VVIISRGEEEYARTKDEMAIMLSPPVYRVRVAIAHDFT